MALSCTPRWPVAQNPRDNSRTNPSDLFLQPRAKWQQRPPGPALVLRRDALSCTQIAWHHSNQLFHGLFLCMWAHKQSKTTKSHQDDFLIPEKFTPWSEWIDLAEMNTHLQKSSTKHVSKSISMESEIRSQFTSAHPGSRDV